MSNGDITASITGDVSGQLAVGNHITQSAGSQPTAPSGRGARRAPSPSGGTPEITVFISYRRADTEGHAGRLRDWLVERFGEDGVFEDVDSIHPGEDYVSKLEQTLQRADVVLALIGRQWVTTRDVAGRRRLDDPEDWVRLELETALRRDVTVIPVLVQGATMPSQKDLPEPLVPLTRRNAITIGSAWADDVARLEAAIERATGLS
jgi:hypothetical protein